ncbi:hypothetical protein [Thalassospira sp.]|uniref:hypothetical protein n=1 Tax=Thalassospira sp. TaxID=1912094 RepID=UPI000C6157AA|nr:hypothetical protein [Thalassospira sp.]MBC08306.1 hypothetical protein [Thalassospira sp.]|tara:strand:+ start:7432 stop:8094 length:663 start_codon:yes stop_codon:yes gene_type:complete
MSKDTDYISPEYNPHSLQRDWGFLICEQHPEIIEAFSGSLSDLRARLHESSVGKFAQNDANAPLTAGAPAKVTTDGLAANRSSLYDEVGLDILTLALLSDVPAHRSLHLTQNSLIGHWRWLRDVWRYCARHPQCDAPPHPHSTVTTALQSGKNNLAIAHLRDLFKKVQQAPNDAGLCISFLSSLSLFCPFIGTELLWRQGWIDHDPVSRSRTTGIRGTIE